MLAAALSGLLGSCAYLGGAGPDAPPVYTLTIDNRACIIPARLLIDGQDAGSTDAYSRRGFQVSPGPHTFQLPGSLNPQVYTGSLTGNLTWRVRSCF